MCAASAITPKRPVAAAAAAIESSDSSLVDRVQKVMEKASEQAQMPASPGSPSRSAVLQRLHVQPVEGSPRKVLAKRLDALRFSSQETSPLAACLQVAPKPIYEKPVVLKPLALLLDRYQTKFWEYIKANSTDPKVRLGERVYVEPLVTLREVFLSVTDRSFLDRYIIRDSLPEEEQQEFKNFHELLLKLKTQLKGLGVDSLKEGQTINFWSGREGQARAAEDPEGFSDSDVPLFKCLFDCWGYIKAQETMTSKQPLAELIELLPIVFSAMFATYASGDVNVYMASKNDGTHSVINVESAFWNAELYALIQNPKVTKVNLYLHMGKNSVTQEDAWSEPIDLKSEDEKIQRFREEIICLSRRGEKELMVPIATLKKTLRHWKSFAVREGLINGAKDLEQTSKC